MSKKNKISFVFFGSGPVAAESLRLLHNSFDIEAIITKASTEKELASVCPDTTVYTVQNKKELDELFSIINFKSNLGVLIDFGIIVSLDVINYFEYGIINSHFSLLPELRGADPISFSILEGKEMTGVSLMLLVEAMDEGPILAISEQKLTGNETTPELTEKLINLSYDLLQNAIPKYLDGTIDPAEQSVVQEKLNLKPSYTRKLTKKDGEIDWQKSAKTIEREIRAYAGWPKSYTTFGDIDVVILKASVIFKKGEAGKLFIFNKQLCVYCGESALCIEQLKPAGKKTMDSQAFLAGYKNRLPL